MKTQCPECQNLFEVDDRMFGQTTNCPTCTHAFIATWAVLPSIAKPKLDISKEVEADDEEPDDSSEIQATLKRRSPKQVMIDKIKEIGDKIESMLPTVEIAAHQGLNESDTRMLIDRILVDILGYRIDEVKTEQKIQGRKADYVLSIDNEDILVVEVKRCGMALRDKQVFQATSYGAYAGIRWALLTNLQVWHLYRISMGDKVEPHLVFTLDLRDGLDNTERHYFYLLSRHGMNRRNLLEQLWEKIRALSYENLVSVLLTEDVITKIRTTLSKECGCKLSQEEVRNALETTILQLN